MKSKFLVALSLALTLSACSSSVSFNRYSMTQDLTANSLDPDIKVSVSLAQFLDVGGIVMQTSPVSVQEASTNRWAEPLNVQLEKILKDEIAKESLNNNLIFDIYVSKFQGSVDGNVYISLFVKVSKINTEDTVAEPQLLLKEQYDVITELRSDGYNGLVTDLKNNYKAICKDLIDKLKVSKF